MVGKARKQHISGLIGCQGSAIMVSATLASIAVYCVHAQTRCMKMLSAKTDPFVRTFAMLAISPNASNSTDRLEASSKRYRMPVSNFSMDENCFLSVRSALYVFNAARDLGSQFEWREDSLVARQADKILRDAVALLRQMDSLGLFKALEAGLFAGIKRSPEGGRGLEGVIERNPGYFNPFYEELLA